MDEERLFNYIDDQFKELNDYIIREIGENPEIIVALWETRSSIYAEVDGCLNLIKRKNGDL